MSRLKKIASHSFGLDDIGIFSESMKKIYQQALKYHQDRSLPILIQGETGTGKEIIAKLIHYGDLDEVALYIDLNCAAISHGLFESELFGYEAGSFTGSLNSGKKGKFDLAAGGTLFFDEVTEIPIDLQAKLLRVIQEKEFYRVGGLKKTKTDVRIICATNADLESKISEGGFRKDLYYRLKVGHIIIPPLRERSEEILPLTRGFLKEYSQKRGKKFIGISDNAKRILHQYPWPGNVRELKNTIEWVTFMYDDQELQPHHLDIITTTGRSSEKPVGDVPAPAVNRRMSLDNFTNQLILEVLNRNKGNMKETARELGISRSTLYNRLKTGK